MQFPFQVILSFLTPIVCCLPASDSAYAQIDIQEQIQEFETGSKIDQMTALRSMASLVIRGEATIDQRQQVLNFLKEATKQSSPEIRLTVYVELLKVGLAENNLEIGNFALKAIDDKNLNVHRGILRYFRTFFSKRYSSGKSYTPILMAELDDEDLDVRFQSAMTLHSWGISNDKIVNILIESLQLTNYRAGIIYALTSDQTNRDRTVANVVKKLNQSNQNEGTHINVLSLLAPDSNYSMPLILEKFSSDQPQTRAAVVAAIGRMKIMKDRSLEILKLGLQDEVGIVRRLSLASLVQLEPETEVIKDAIIKLLRDPDASVAEVAAAAIAQFENNFDILLTDLRPILSSGNYQQLLSVLGGLDSCGPVASAAAPDVANLLKHKNPDIRTRACWALAAISNDSQLVIDSINQLIANEDDTQVLMTAIQMLDEIPATDPISKSTYLKFLEHENEFVRLLCVSGLSAYKDPELVDRLIKIQQEQNQSYGQNLNQLGIAIVKTIVNSGQAGIEKAANYLDDANPIVRGRALRIAASSEPPMPNFKTQLLTALTDKDAATSLYGAYAASVFKSSDAEILEAMFNLTNADYRQKTVNILNLFAKMGKRAAPITPKIATLMDGAYRKRFANDSKRVLMQLEHNAAPAIPELISGSFNPNKLECLAAIGVKDAAAADALRKYIEQLQKNADKHTNVRAIANNRRNSIYAAAALSQVSDDNQTITQFVLKELQGDFKAVALTAIRRIDNPTPQIIEAVTELLPEKDAIKTLTKIGPPAKTAVNKLKEILESPERPTSDLAGQALSHITNDPEFAIQVVNRIIQDNRFQTVDIKVDQRQTLWSSLRYLQKRHSQQKNVSALMDELERSRFSNIRSFVKDLRSQT